MREVFTIISNNKELSRGISCRFTIEDGENMKNCDGKRKIRYNEEKTEKRRSIMTKEIVLAMLKEQLRNGQSGFISGEKISEKIGVSRMAVSAAVKQLREDGYDITSVTRRGYKLNQSPDRLSQGELLPLLGEERMRKVLCLETVDSTNKRLRELALEEKAPHGMVLLANEQTSGKGKKQTRFSSPKNKGIYLSMRLVSPVERAEDMPEFTKQLANAAAKAIASVIGFSVEVTDSNELFLNGKKICGMLTELSVEAESMTINDCIVGIGLRVHHGENDFEEETREKQSSIFRETGKHFSRAELSAALIRELDRV